jgi:hypothetical protein
LRRQYDKDGSELTIGENGIAIPSVFVLFLGMWLFR